MKKLSLLFLVVSVFAFCGCSNDDDEKKGGGEEIGGGEAGGEDDGKKEAIISFEDLLTKPESEFIATGTPSAAAFQEATITDPKEMVSLRHYYADWGGGYSFAGFTYMNKTDNQTSNSPAPISGKGKTGKVYIAVDSTEGDYGTPAYLTILNAQYNIKGTWITNSTYAYTGMTEGDSNARKFEKGDWYKVTATGYNKTGEEIGKSEIFLANYKSNDDKPINDWIWFDLTPLQDAVKIKFIPSCTDNNGPYMNTAAYFCLDGITLIEK